MSGSDTKCGTFKPNEYNIEGCGACATHYPGTAIMGAGKIYLGLPRGMNKVGDCPPGEQRIRLWEKGFAPKWDVFNIPVWYKQEGEDLIVKTVQPRRMRIWIDIIEGATKDIIKVEGSGDLNFVPNFAITPFDVGTCEDID